MRWILPFLSLALLPSAFGEIAVYTGVMTVQNASTTGKPSLVRVADVIDLATGKIVTVGLTGGRTDFSYVVGPEVQYVIAKTNDGHGHGSTALAQASSNTDSAGSTFALSANLRGRDVAVTLGDAGSSQWPRTLVGTGSLVASAGNDPVATPASVSLSVIALTLSDALSKTANAAGGTLSQAAEVIAQQFRNRTAATLKFTPVNATVSTGSIGAGVIITKAGSGTLMFGSTTSAFNGSLTLNSGTLRLTNTTAPTGITSTGAVSAINLLPVSAGFTFNSGATFSAGSSLVTGGSTLQLRANTPGFVSGGSVTFTNPIAITNPIPITFTGSATAATSINGGTLTTAPILGSTSGAIMLNSGTLGTISSSGASITRIGSGTLTLSSGGVYNATTGTVTYNGIPVIVANGSSLTLNGTTYLSNGGVLTPIATTSTGGATTVVVTTATTTPDPTTTDPVDPATPAQ
jgi:autotransporter-associated beta strand protein